MTALIAGLVGAAFLILIALAYVGVRRMERDVDYTGFGAERPDDRLAHTAQLVANVLVAAP
jgi:hypothetical protein